MSKTTNKFSPEVRARAVGMVMDHDVGFLGEIEIAAIGLAFTGECGLEIGLGLRSSESHDPALLLGLIATA